MFSYNARGLVRALISASCIAVVLLWWMSLASAAEEARRPDSEKAVRLAIVDFAKLAGQARFDILRRRITELLQVAFLAYDFIHVVPLSESSRGVWTSWGLPGSQLPQRSLPFDVLQGQNVDLLLSGNFVELDGTFQVSAVLFDLKTNQPIKVNPVSLTQTEILSGIESLAAEVIDALSKSKAVRFTPRRFAVSCFVDKSSRPSSAGKLLGRDLAVFLPQQLGGRPGRRVLSWSTVQGFCDKPQAGLDLARALKVDAIITGSINAEGTRVFIYPELVIAEFALTLEIPPIEGKLEQYLTLIGDVGKRVREFWDGSMTEDGIWKVGELAGSRMDSEGYLKRGKELFEQGDMSLATLFFQKTLAIQPQYEANYYLGLIRLNQKRFQEAADEFKKALAINSDFALGQKSLGDAYAGSQQYQQAIDAYEAALRLNPNLTAAYGQIGNIYYFQGKYDRAKEYYQRAVVKEPRNVEMYYRLAVVSARQANNQDEAITWYKKALEISPDYAPAKRGLALLFHNIGMVARQKKDYPQAVAEFTRAITINATPDGYFYRAISGAYVVANQSAPDYSPVIADYLTALQFSGDARQTFRNRTWALLNLTEIFILARQYKDASNWAQKSLEELREQPTPRIIARFLLIVSRILGKQEYAEELARLRPELSTIKEDVNWGFDLLETFLDKTSELDTAAREQALTIISEMKAATERKTNR